MIVVFNKIVLADLKREIVTARVTIDGRVVVETQDYPEADEIGIFLRGNLSKHIAFEATRSHETEEKAELFVHTHSEEVLLQASLLMGGSFGGWERFYNNAACLSCSSYAEGCRTWSNYEFVTGLISKKKK